MLGEFYAPVADMMNAEGYWTRYEKAAGHTSEMVDFRPSELGIWTEATKCASKLEDTHEARCQEAVHWAMDTGLKDFPHWYNKTIGTLQEGETCVNKVWKFLYDCGSDCSHDGLIQCTVGPCPDMDVNCDGTYDLDDNPMDSIDMGTPLIERLNWAVRDDVTGWYTDAQERGDLPEGNSKFQVPWTKATWDEYLNTTGLPDQMVSEEHPFRFNKYPVQACIQIRAGGEEVFGNTP